MRKRQDCRIVVHVRGDSRYIRRLQGHDRYVLHGGRQIVSLVDSVCDRAAHDHTLTGNLVLSKATLVGRGKEGPQMRSTDAIASKKIGVGFPMF